MKKVNEKEGNGLSDVQSIKYTKKDNCFYHGGVQRNHAIENATKHYHKHTFLRRVD